VGILVVVLVILAVCWLRGLERSFGGRQGDCAGVRVDLQRHPDEYLGGILDHCDSKDILDFIIGRKKPA